MKETNPETEQGSEVDGPITGAIVVLAASFAAGIVAQEILGIPDAMDTMAIFIGMCAMAGGLALSLLIIGYAVREFLSGDRGRQTNITDWYEQ